MAEKLHRFWAMAFMQQFGSIIGHLPFYKLNKKPIFIFTTRRSGSTLLLRMIYSQPRFDFIDLPLDFMHFHPHHYMMPKPQMKNRFINLNPNDEKMLYDYFKALLDGRYRLRNQSNPFTQDFSFIVNRLVIRDVNAKYLIDWFSKNFDIETIYLVRHPVPVALSLVKTKWTPVADAFLNNDFFKKEFLNPEKERISKEILSNGTPLQKFVLEWCFENIYLLRICKQRPWFTLTYEELLIRPKQVVGLMCSRFGLPDPNRMYERISKPTNSAPKSSKKDMQEKGNSYIAKRWLNQVTSKELEDVNQILTSFGIDAYNAFEIFPSSKLCHFGPLGKKTEI